MTNTKKRITAILLTLALILTMMPAMALTAFAADADKAFDVSVNGVVVASVDKAWMRNEENMEDPQVFPFAGGFAKQKVTMKFTVAKGPSFSLVLRESLGITGLDAIEESEIEWLDVPEGGGKPENLNGFTLKVKDLQSATTQFFLTNGETDVEITGDVTKNNNVLAKARQGAEPIIPIVAVVEKEGFENYQAAATYDFDNAPSEEKTTDIEAFIGGNIREGDKYLKKDGVLNGDSVNFTGKYAIRNAEILNVRMQVPAASNMVFSTKEGRIAPLDYPLGQEALETMANNAVWTSSNNTVATVEKGIVKPVSPGTCIVTAKASTDSEDAIATFNVSVEKSAFPAPAMPKNLKVKNVKKKTAKLSWNKAANAEGYEVYRSVKKKKGFKRVASVSGNSFKNKKLKKGKTYYYKVRSFNTVNGKKVYSKFSAVKKVKIRK